MRSKFFWFGYLVIIGLCFNYLIWPAYLAGNQELLGENIAKASIILVGVWFGYGNRDDPVEKSVSDVVKED